MSRDNKIEGKKRKTYVILLIGNKQQLKHFKWISNNIEDNQKYNDLQPNTEYIESYMIRRNILITWIGHINSEIQ